MNDFAHQYGLFINYTLSDYPKTRHARLEADIQVPWMASLNPSMEPGFVSQSSAPAIPAGMMILENMDHVI